MSFNLSDSWRASGKDLSEYTALVKELSDATRFVLAEPKDITMYYLLEAGLEGYYKVCRFDINDLDKFNDKLTAWKTTSKDVPTFNVGHIRKTKLNMRLADESFGSNGFILEYKGKAIYVSNKAKPTLCLRGKIAGEWTARHTLFQAMDIIEAINNSGNMMTMVIRECENEETKLTESKAFAFLSAKYTDIPLSILPKAIKTIMADGKLGKAEVYGWYMDHTFTEIQIEFPDAGEDFATLEGQSTPVIPGLVMMSSDTGSSSLIIRGTYRIKGGNRYVVVDEYAHKHAGTITTEDVLEACDTHIMGNFRNLPEALADKMIKIIGNGKTETPEEMVENKNAVANAIKAGMKKLGLRSTLGLQRFKGLQEQMIESIDPETVYSEYDIAMLFLGLPDRVDGLSKELQVRLAKDCGKAPFIDYKASSAKSDESSVVLLPED